MRGPGKRACILFGILAIALTMESATAGPPPIVSGDSNKAAAIKLGISPRTVEIYRANVMTKMHANSLSELVRMALQIEQR